MRFSSSYIDCCSIRKQQDGTSLARSAINDAMGVSIAMPSTNGGDARTPVAESSSSDDDTSGKSDNSPTTQDALICSAGNE